MTSTYVNISREELAALEQQLGASDPICARIRDAFHDLDDPDLARYRAVARQRASEGDLEVDHNALVSKGRGRRRLRHGLALDRRRWCLRESPMILKIGSRFSIEVATFQEASAAYARCRDASFEGASTFPTGVIFDGNRTIARVSYNAKVWPPETWSKGQAPLFNPYAKS